MVTVARFLAPVLQSLWIVGLCGAVLVFILFAAENIRVLLERDDAPSPPSDRAS